MRWKPKKKNWSKITRVAKKTGMEIKTMKETKNLEIGGEKKHEAEKTFLLSKNFISVAKKLFCVTKILLA